MHRLRHISFQRKRWSTDGDNFYQHPVGTGPFRLAYWREFSEILLVKNESYWGNTKFKQPLPLLDEIKISLITSQPVAASEFIKGNSNILWVSNSTLTKMKSAQDFTDNYNLYITNSPSSVRFWGFSMNNKSPFANNKYLRRAAAYVYNRNLIIEKAAEDYNIANSLVPEEFLGDANLEWYTHNIQKANALFNENKHVVYDHDITISTPVDFAATKILEDALSNLGFNINVKIQNLRYYNHIVEDRPDIFRVAMTPSYPDPEEYYSLFYSKSEKFVNLCGYNNPEYDILFERALIEMNKDERRNLFLKLEELLKDDVPLLPMTHSAKDYCIVPKYIKGFSLKNGVPDYTNVWMDIKDDKTN
ncbi:MAG: ABC transporter substrate-binding protein [Melioribacteraceae bacterium]|nr:ABC transporter substrate-binding protein [Melioribacteraceae bacterium]